MAILFADKCHGDTADHLMWIIQLSTCVTSFDTNAAEKTKQDKTDKKRHALSKDFRCKTFLSVGKVVVFCDFSEYKINVL